MPNVLSTTFISYFILAPEIIMGVSPPIKARVDIYSESHDMKLYLHQILLYCSNHGIIFNH